MTGSVFAELVRGLIIACGVDRADAMKLTSKSARKHNPTVADILQFDDTLSHALGDWQEVPKGQNPRASRATFTMPKTYADNKLAATRQVHQICFQAPLETKQIVSSLAILIEAGKASRAQPDRGHRQADSGTAKDSMKKNKGCWK